MPQRLSGSHGLQYACVPFSVVTCVRSWCVGRAIKVKSSQSRRLPPLREHEAPHSTAIRIAPLVDLWYARLAVTSLPHAPLLLILTPPPYALPCTQIANANLTKEQIHRVEVVGGATRIPRVKEAAMAFFAASSVGRRLTARSTATRQRRWARPCTRPSCPPPSGCASSPSRTRTQWRPRYGSPAKEATATRRVAAKRRRRGGRRGRRWQQGRQGQGQAAV